MLPPKLTKLFFGGFDSTVPGEIPRSDAIGGNAQIPVWFETLTVDVRDSTATRIGDFHCREVHASVIHTQSKVVIEPLI